MKCNNRAQEGSLGIILTLFRRKQVRSEEVPMESIPDDWEFPFERFALYAIEEKSLNHKIYGILLKYLILESARAAYILISSRYFEAPRTCLIFVRVLRYVRRGITCPEFLSRANRNQWSCRKRTRGDSTFLSSPPSCLSIKSCCWKYHLGKSPRPRYTGSLQSVGRDSPSFSDSHWWISIIWQTSFETSTVVCWPTCERAVCGNTERSSFPRQEYQKRARILQSGNSLLLFHEARNPFVVHIANVYSHPRSDEYPTIR